MRDGAPSRTAEATAGIRATHFLFDERPLVFEDPFAIELIAREQAERCRLRGMHPGGRGPAAVVLGRSRYAEDSLEAAIRSGVEQYVIMGAGLDSFALRRPDLLVKIRAYEVDHPATQTWKRDCLARTGRALSPAHEFIPCDFEYETIADGLRRSSFRSDRRAFFSWLGTTMYLSREAVFRTLESIRETSAPGSEVFFDYRVLDDFLAPEDVPRVHASYQGTAKMGEPQLSWWNPLTLPNEVAEVGFEPVEFLSPDQLGHRYFAGRSDGMWPQSHHWYAYIRRR